MNKCLIQLLKTTEDQCPGLLFDEHVRAGAPKRVYRSGHTKGIASTAKEIASLKELCGSMSNGLSDLVALYTLHNGLSLYRMPNMEPDTISYAVQLYPFSEWDDQTKRWTGEEMAWAMEDCPLYKCGPWKVIGGFNSEAMSIVMFFGGSCEGVAQAGRCYCIGLDGYLGYEEVLAETFGELACQLSSNQIVETFDLVGFSGFIPTDIDGGVQIGYGDVVKQYLPDVTGNPYLVP